MNFRQKVIFKYLLLFVFQVFLLSNAISNENKVVLITGATRGVGLATAEYLAEQGYRVYASGRSKPLFSNEMIQFEYLDVANQSNIQKAVRSIINKEGRIDILINNAGYGLVGPVETCSIEEFRKQMDVNFFGVIGVCQEVLPYMRTQKSGRIISMSSTNAISPAPYGSAYSSSKAALESLLEVLSVEVSPWNIFVSIVEPGLIQTKFSLLMGSRKIEHNPYRKITNFIQTYLDNRLKHPEQLSPSQTPENIAKFLHQIIESSTPLLRYQTSDEAKRVVSKKLTDITGDIYLTEIKENLKDWPKVD